jgi:hypothetical protein
MDLQVQEQSIFVMTAKANLLLHIQSSLSSEWTKTIKDTILSNYKQDKDFQKILTKDWVDQQVSEIESDPLEKEVLGNNGVCLASRAVDNCVVVVEVLCIKKS